jgi:guanidinoacetate N-methyltransferase
MSSLEYGQDAQTGEEVLRVTEATGDPTNQGAPRGGWPVMMEWERDYMCALVHALEIDSCSAVLEIGFGLGISATKIWEQQPASYTCIEPDPVVLKKLREWAKGKPDVTVVEGTWQQELPKLGFYDCIFFDDCPLPTTVDEYHKYQIFDDSARWQCFIDSCVGCHMHAGARITGYLTYVKGTLTSIKARNCTISVRPHRLKQAPIMNCPYWPPDQDTAYIPVVKLLGDCVLPTCGTEAVHKRNMKALSNTVARQSTFERRVLSKVGLDIGEGGEGVGGSADGGSSASRTRELVEAVKKRRRIEACAASMNDGDREINEDGKQGEAQSEAKQEVEQEQEQQEQEQHHQQHQHHQTLQRSRTRVVLPAAKFS